MDKLDFILVTLLFAACATVYCEARDDEDDENYDPYTTMDPKKREPSPCESM